MRTRRLLPSENVILGNVKEGRRNEAWHCTSHHAAHRARAAAKQREGRPACSGRAGHRRLVLGDDGVS